MGWPENYASTCYLILGNFVLFLLASRTRMLYSATALRCCACRPFTIRRLTSSKASKKNVSTWIAASCTYAGIYDVIAVLRAGRVTFKQESPQETGITEGKGDSSLGTPVVVLYFRYALNGVATITFTQLLYTVT